MDNNELLHFRTKGSKNGVRLYQYKDGSLTPLGRIRYAKNKKSDDDKKKETPKPKTKEEALKSGSAKELMEFKGDISADEYQKVFKRFEDEKKLTSYSETETKTALDKFDDIMSKVDRVRVGSEKAISAYNTIAKVNNAFNPSFRLPEIKEGQINRVLDRTEKTRDALRTARKLDVAEERYGTDGAKVLSNLTTEEIKEFNTRTQQKSQVKNRLDGNEKANKESKKQKTEDKAKKQKTEDKAKKQKAGEESKKKTADNTIKIDEDILREAAAEGYAKYRKTNEEAGKSNSTTNQTGAVKGMKWGVRVRTSDQDKSKALALINQTASSALALYNSGKSVADIAKQYGISESAVYKMLEELK